MPMILSTLDYYELFLSPTPSYPALQCGKFIIN